MKKEEIQNLVKDLVEKVSMKLQNISTTEDGTRNTWVSVEVSEPHFFVSREGEGLQALNHLVHRIVEARSSGNPEIEKNFSNIIIDINGFQKKRIENIRAVAHMMSERARYFKSNIEVDPMSAFDRRIVHEFLADAADLKTESVGTGRARRIVIKYIGNI